MTGRQKIESALSPGGTPQIAAVIPYEYIYLRDHWRQLTDCPWWYLHAPDIERQLQWLTDVIERTGQDWFHIPVFYSARQRQDLWLDVGDGGVFLCDRFMGSRERLESHLEEGWQSSRLPEDTHRLPNPSTEAEVDAAIPLPRPIDRAELRASGRCDFADALLARFGKEKLPINGVTSPLWNCHNYWSFEELMIAAVQKPDLVQYACRRLLADRRNTIRAAAEAGARAMWLEECFTDMISPALYERINVPVMREIVAEIRACGMASVFYYCGNPNDRWEQLLAIGADALSLEESKKGFTIEIGEVARRCRGRCAVLGNLDAISLLPTATDCQLRDEIARQIDTGRSGGGRFVMSLGSPVTPATHASQVRRYCDLVRELGAC